MMGIFSLGTGGHSQVIADAILSRSCLGGDFVLNFFQEDNPGLTGKGSLGVRVLGTIGQLSQFDHDAVVIGIGENIARSRLFARLQAYGERFARIIHPRTILATDVQIDGGTVVNAGSIIGPDVIISIRATVDNHERIGAHAHIAPGVDLGGAVSVGEATLMGIASSVMPGRLIGEWAIFGADAVVTQDSPANSKAVGDPARIVKTRKAGRQKRSSRILRRQGNVDDYDFLIRGSRHFLFKYIPRALTRCNAEPGWMSRTDKNCIDDYRALL